MAPQTYPKWPRTYHHALSGSLQNDDRRLPTTARFIDADGAPRRCLYTEKLDGENHTMTREVCYPRSPDGRYHASRDLMKSYWASRARDIPAGWRVSGEYMLALHSVAYSRTNGNALSSPFYAFGVWDETNTLLAWDDMLEILEILDVPHVPVLHDGPWDEAVVRRLIAEMDPKRSEGFVVRVADAIPYPSGPGDLGRFWLESCKVVREGHVAGNSHWASGQWYRNDVGG